MTAMEAIQTKKIEYLKVERKAPAKNPNNFKTPFILKTIQWSFRKLGPIFPKFFGKLAWNMFQRPASRAKHRNIDDLIKSADVFDLNYLAHNIKIYSWGSGTKTALLVHGWASRGTGMRSFVPYLVEKGYRVVAFDGPAHGDSSGKKTNPFFLAKFTKRIIEFVGGVDTVIAHSFGAFSVSLLFSRLDTNIPVRKLVLVAPFSNSDVAFSFFQKFMGYSDKVRFYKEQAAHKTIGIHPMEGDIRNIKQSDNIGEVMMVHDKNDNDNPVSNSYHYFENWERIQFLQTEGLGHYPILKSPKVLERITQFIERY